MSRIEKIIDVSECQEKKIFGEFDSYLRIIEKAFDVTVIERDGKMKIIGEETGIDNCESVIRQLSQLAASDTQITDQTVNYAISLAMENDHSSLSDLDSNIVCRTVL